MFLDDILLYVGMLFFSSFLFRILQLVKEKLVR